MSVEPEGTCGASSAVSASLISFPPGATKPSVSGMAFKSTAISRTRSPAGSEAKKLFSPSNALARSSPTWVAEVLNSTTDVARPQAALRGRRLHRQRESKFVPSGAVNRSKARCVRRNGRTSPSGGDDRRRKPQTVEQSFSPTWFHYSGKSKIYMRAQQDRVPLRPARQRRGSLFSPSHPVDRLC